MFYLYVPELKDYMLFKKKETEEKPAAPVALKDPNVTNVHAFGSGEYEIRYFKPNCIAADICTFIDPKHFKMNQHEQKVELIGGKESGDGWFRVDIKPEELKAAIEAAGGCPAGVIHVYDKKTGEKVLWTTVE